LIVKRRKIARAAARWYSKLLHPIPLAMLGVLCIAFLAFSPLPITILATLLLPTVPLLYSYLSSKRSSPSISCQREFPALTAEHDAREREEAMRDSEHAELTTHYTSPVEAKADTEAMIGSPMTREGALERETMATSLPKQMAPKPRVVI